MNGTWVAAKLLRAAATLLLSVTVVFLVLRLAGDPAEILFGDNVGPETMARYRALWGLDQPLGVQYLLYLRSLLQGDFGLSSQDGSSAWQLVMGRLPYTLQLGGASLLLATLIGIPAGMTAALARGSLADRLVMLVAVSGFCIPNFVLGVLLILVFAAQYGWLPSHGAGTAWHLVLPAITLGTSWAAVLARFARSAMLEVLGQPYIRGARAAGLTEARVRWRHALPNAAIPLVTILGFMVGGLVAGAIVTESIFAWPGVGRLLVDSVKLRDLAVVQAIVLMVAATMVTANLIVDLLSAWLNPRLHAATGA
ncbi:ABC transporter permease [Falsiroseomonas sp.]|uniref:ABC transporter permease n=1 Tax=Falsiroseomonas sp. TaxID=2870721 RepID=UPI0034A4DD7B